nr:Cyanophycinase [uncultured bacterium]
MSDSSWPAAEARLVIIGGAEDRTGERRVLREFVRMSGGEAARLVIVPVGSSFPDEVGREYEEAFRALGVSEVARLAIDSREHAKKSDMLALVERATGVFFTGGDQMRIMSVLGGTPFDTLLHRRSTDGLVIGGTSAGAAIMSATMIVSGDTSAVRLGAVQTGPGMEFLRGVIIDQHFAQRGRIARLLAVVAQFPHELGMGIDENTAVVVEGHTCRVIGSGSVTILDAGAGTFNDALDVGPGACIALGGVTLHSLPEGCRFDLLERVPLARS